MIRLSTRSRYERAPSLYSSSRDLDRIDTSSLTKEQNLGYGVIVYNAHCNPKVSEKRKREIKKTKKYMIARDSLVTSCLLLAKSISGKYYAKNGIVSSEDLIGVAYSTLMRAVERFDPSKSKFNTFVKRLIEQDLGMYINKH